MTDHARPRVLLVAPGELWGGVERCTLTLARWFSAQGNLAGVVALYDGPLARALAGFPEAHVARGAVARSPRRLLAWLRTLVDKANPDVVHVHGYKAAVLGCLVAGVRRLPVVRTVHGLPEERWSRLAAYTRVDDWVCRLSECATAYVSRDLWQQAGSPPLSAVRQVIWNGLDFARQPATRHDRGVFNIGIVGRLSPVKGHDVALAALAMLLRSTPAHLFVIGEGPLDESLRRQAASLDISEQVSFVGFQQDMDTWYATFDAMVMPSRHEGLPYALLEAMGEGLPVVASAVGGIVEAIEHERNGLLVTPGAPDDLAGALELLARDTALRQRLGQAAATTARERFSAEAMASAYERLYRARVATHTRKAAA